MAILGFPSTAIIGDLDWTGTSSNLTATENLSLTGGNIISGGVYINSPRAVYLSAPSVDGMQGLSLGSGVAELYVDDGASYVRVIQDGEGVQIMGAGFVSIDAPFFWYKGVNVATQPFSIAMAIALG